ncbi:MAG: type II secretion system protein GspM [Burkholderiaceae bacterium]
MTAPARWQRGWSGLAARERRLVLLALGMVLLALTWALVLAPALRTARAAPAQSDRLDQQLQVMQAMAAQARDLKGRPVVRREDALRVLQSTLAQRLGAGAQLTPAGERVTVTLSGVAPELLAPWLGQARSAARVVVVQARLNRGSAGWDGSIVLQLPPP